MKSIMYFMGQAAVLVLLLLSAGGCTDKVEVDVPAYDEGDDVPIVIRASDEMPGTATRASDGTTTDGVVKNRKDFLFTYPSSKDGGKMKSLPCRFDDRGYGYVYISDEQTLTRGDILFKKDKEGKEVAEVYLDNLVDYPVQEADETAEEYNNFTRMEFGTGSGTDFKPYYMVAPDGSSVIPQAPEGSTSTTDENTKDWDVDILWGKLTYAKTDKLLEFKLKHKMSKVTFRFFSNDKTGSGINSKLDGENITVKLENIKTAVYDERMSPSSSYIPGFRRDKGEIVSTSADAKSTVTILNGGELDGKTKSDGAEPETYYYAPDYIFPPHNYSAATQNKAKLTIDLNGEKYSGPFPSTMLYTIKDEDGKDITVSDDMAFLSGYHLTIDVELADNFDDRELLFHGIKVADFKYDFTETNNESRECGIYSLEDLKTLIALYNSLGDDDKEDYRLYKYGTFNDDTKQWTFYLWIDIVISKEDMGSFTKFNNGYFELNFNGYKILKRQGSTDEELTKENLCDKNTETSTSPTNL